MVRVVSHGHTILPTISCGLLTSHSPAYLMTMPLHCLLYSSMPILATSSGPLIPKVLSISYSYTKKEKSVRPNKCPRDYSVNLHRLFSKILKVFIITHSYHRQAMTVPAKSPVHVEAALVSKASNNVLDGAG